MKQPMVLIGAGGLGREIAWQFSLTQRLLDTYDFLGFIDDDPALAGRRVDRIPVLGGLSWLYHYPEKISAAICIADPKVRREIYDKLKPYSHISFPPVILGDAALSLGTHLGQGVILCMKSCLTTDIHIGDFVILDRGSMVGHDTWINDFTTLYPRVTLSGHVRIGEGAQMGTCSAVIQGKIVGENAILGAGAIVVSDIPANCTAVGVPAKAIRFHKT